MVCGFIYTCDFIVSLTDNEPVITAEPENGKPLPVPPPPKDDVGIACVLPELLPTHAYPCCKDAVKLPVILRAPVSSVLPIILFIPESCSFIELPP